MKGLGRDRDGHKQNPGGPMCLTAHNPFQLQDQLSVLPGSHGSDCVLKPYPSSPSASHLNPTTALLMPLCLLSALMDGLYYFSTNRDIS